MHKAITTYTEEGDNGYQSAAYTTLKRRKIFGIHIIQNTMVLTESSIKDVQRYRFVEIPQWIRTMLSTPSSPASWTVQNENLLHELRAESTSWHIVASKLKRSYHACKPHDIRMAVIPITWEKRMRWET